MLRMRLRRRFALRDLLEYTSPPFFDPLRDPMNEPALPVPTRTVFARAGSVRGDWYLIDAEGKTLGRLATQIAHRLKGKHKADYSPHVDMGDHIVVVNAAKIRVTGRKLTDKIYYHHTGYIGGIKSIALEKLLNEHPERAIEIAVKGMLPKNPLGRAMFRKLHVFAGSEHPHKAQQPKRLEIQ
jgi:large subunit ribosomal protein L13